MTKLLEIKNCGCCPHYGTDREVEPACKLVDTEKLGRKLNKALSIPSWCPLPSIRYTRQLEPAISPYEIPHAAVDKYFTPPEPPVDKVEAVAKVLAVQTLADESLDASDVWQWVMDNDFVDEYLEKALEILKTYQPKLTRISDDEIRYLRKPDGYYAVPIEGLEGAYIVAQVQLNHDRKTLKGE